MPKVTFDLADALLHFRFSELRGVVRLAERLVKDEAHRFREHVEARAAAMSEEMHNEFLEYMSDEYWQLHERFPSLLRQALFLTIYAEIEAHLNRVCSRSQTRRKVRLSLRDVRGRGIERAKLYLSRAVGVAFPSDEREWQELKKYNKLRNLFAHSEGRLSEQKRDDDLRKYVKAHAHLKLGSRRHVIIEEGFCEEVIDMAVSFFRQLPKELRP